MSLRINDEAPDFTADTTQGTISFHDWIGDGWALLFSHPKDFTPVCTTELGAVAGLKDDFAARNCKIIGISVDGVSDHQAWSGDIESATGNALNYPLIGDPELAHSQAVRHVARRRRRPRLRVEPPLTTPPPGRCSSSVLTRRSR